MNINLQQAKSLIKNNKIIAYIEQDNIPVYTDIHEFVPFNDMVFKSICLDLLHTNNVLLIYSDNITFNELSTINNNNLLDNVILYDDWKDVTSLKDLKFFTGFNILKNLSDDNEIFANIEEIDMRNISSVGSYTFLDHTGISLYNTYNITTINAHAFDNAIILNNTLSFNSLTTIGLYAFYNAQFNSIIHLGTTTALSEHCFENTIFTNITFNSNNITIGNYCFKGATIGHLTGESNITSIGNNAFENVDTNMYLHLSGLTSLGSSAFKGCNISTITSLGSITAIGEYTFNNCANLTNLDFIPNTVLTIGTHAFDGCTNIKKMQLPLSVTSIGSYAISNCTKLRNIKSLGSITTFTVSMIDTCPNLEIVYFPDTIESLDVVAFNNCANLKIFANIKNYTYLDHCFSNCPKLDTIWFSDTLAEIKVNGILVCDNQFIKTIKLGSYLDSNTGNNITTFEISTETVAIDNEELEINHYPFELMTLLTTIDMNNNMFNILDGVNYMMAFNEVITHIPNPISLLHVSCAISCPITSTNVYTISYSSLLNNQYTFNYGDLSKENNLHNIILEDNENVKYLRYYSYYYPSTDTSLYIKVGKYVESIEMASPFITSATNTYANTITIDFSNAENLKTIQLGGLVFTSSYGYLTLNMPVLPSNLEICSNGFLGSSDSPIRIYNDIVFPPTIKEITNSAFNYIDCNNNTITIPPTADVSIYYRGLSYLQNLKQLNICNYPNHKTRYIYNSFLNIGDNNGNLHFDNFYIKKDSLISSSFASNNGTFTIDNLIFDKDYNISGNYIFALLPIVTNLYLPDDTEKYRVINCAPKHLYNLDGSINGYGQGHSISTTNIQSIEYKNNITHINQFSNYDFSSLKNIIIPNTVEFIGNYAFQNTTSLKEFNMPENIKYIGLSAFLSSNIYDVNLLDVHWIGTNAFKNCNSLKEIIIPASVANYPSKNDLNYNGLYGEIYGSTYNCNYSFANCNNLKHVVLPNNMTSLPRGIFLDCTKLNNINLDNILILEDECLKNTSVNIDLENTQIISIKSYALYGAINTFKPILKLSDTITEIGYAGLSTINDNTIHEIELPLNLHNLYGEVFANHRQLTTINLENINYFDISCLANTNISEIGSDTSYILDFSDTSIKYIGKSFIKNTPLYKKLKKFDLSNTKCPDASLYTLKDICNCDYLYINGSNVYASEIDLSNSNVNRLDTSAFIFELNTDTNYSKKIKLNWKNLNDYINLDVRSICNIYNKTHTNLIIDLDVLNSSLGEISLHDTGPDAYTSVNFINLPLGDVVYIDPSNAFYVYYPTSAERNNDGEYGINTLKFGPTVNKNTNINGGNILKCCKKIDTTDSKMTEINSGQFMNGYFEEIILGNTITSIGGSAFSGCTYLKKVDIGTNIISIGYNAFLNVAPEKLICRAVNPPSIGNGGNTNKLGLLDTNLLGIYVPDESVDVYKTAWSSYTIGTYTLDHFIKPISEFETSTDNYILDGLILHLDGINKGTENGWVDLINNREFSENGNVTKDSSSYIFDGSTNTYLQYNISGFPTFTLDNSTIEICYKLENNDTKYYYIIGSGKRYTYNPLLYVNNALITWNEDGHVYGNYKDGNNDSILFYNTPIILSINGDRCMANGINIGELLDNTDYWDPNNGTMRYRIGSAAGGGASKHPFNGHIYSIRFYNRKLTQAEQLHNLQVDNLRFNLKLTLEE